MCKYCEFEENGDPGEKWDDILWKKDVVKIAFKEGNVLDILKYKAEIKMPIDISAGVVLEKGKWYLSVCIWDNFDPPIIGGEEEMLVYKRKIKFCPMCGRKLIDRKEEP